MWHFSGDWRSQILMKISAAESAVSIETSWACSLEGVVFEFRQEEIDGFMRFWVSYWQYHLLNLRVHPPTHVGSHWLSLRHQKQVYFGCWIRLCHQPGLARFQTDCFACQNGSVHQEHRRVISWSFLALPWCFRRKFRGLVQWVHYHPQQILLDWWVFLPRRLQSTMNRMLALWNQMSLFLL